MGHWTIICNHCGEEAEFCIADNGREYYQCINGDCDNDEITDGTAADNLMFGFRDANDKVLPVPKDHENTFESPLEAFVKTQIVGGAFEDLLSNLEIKLPDPQREGEEDEASIYGETYDQLCREIVYQLKYWLADNITGVDLTNLVYSPEKLMPENK